MKPKVLVVDDESETLTLLDYVLCGEGFEVLTATNGAEALAKANESRPDVVLLDIQLPDMDGFTVCERFRSQAATAGLPVILLSNHSGFSVRARGAEVGCHYCLRKSDSLEAVVTLLRQALVEGIANKSPNEGRRDADPAESETTAPHHRQSGLKDW